MSTTTTVKHQKPNVSKRYKKLAEEMFPHVPYFPYAPGKAVTPGPDNNDRANWAQDSLRTFVEMTGVDDKRDAVSDLLCDLRHWCKREGIDFGLLLDRSAMHFGEEVSEEEQEAEDVTPAFKAWKEQLAGEAMSRFRIDVNAGDAGDDDQLSTAFLDGEKPIVYLARMKDKFGWEEVGN